MTGKRAHQRFGWIEASLRYVGEFDKKAYGEHFHIGAPQISVDQKDFLDTWYEEIAARDVARDVLLQEDHLVIDKGRLVIRHPLPLDPVFDIPSITEWLRSSAIPFHEVQAFRRVDPAPEVIRRICDAIRSRQAIRIDYVSMTSGRTARFISPHGLVDSAGRLHARSFDHLRNEFRDFVLTRIQDVREVQEAPRYVGPEQDREWQEETVLRLVPNPELSADQQDMTRLDYGISAPSGREIRAPRALAFYVQADLVGPGPGHVPPVVLAGSGAETG